MKKLPPKIDFYALPKDFPGYEESRQQTDLQKRIEILEHHFQTDIGDHRFIPYIQCHEFEALLFTDPTQFVAAYPDKDNEIQQLIAVRSSFVSPEDINEGSPPSKRIRAIFPDYNKVSTGLRIAMKIGLAKIRAEKSAFQ